MTNSTIVTIGAIECRAFFTRSPFGTHAHGIAFNENADVIASADSKQYFGYCHTCITADVITRMMPDICPEELGAAIGAPCQRD